MASQNVARSLLGLTQTELAFLLGVSRSLVSLFELGRRDLPAHARLTLAQLLAAAAPPTAQRKAGFESTANHARKKNLEVLLDDATYRLLVLDKKITALERKNATKVSVARLLEVLDIGDGQDVETRRTVLPQIRKRAAPSFDDQDARLDMLSLKKEVLERERQFLQVRVEASQHFR